MPGPAVGLIETRGLIAAIEAADAGLKAANVQLLARYKADAALVTIEFAGEVAAVRSAIDAAAAAASRVGTVVSTHVIARPADQTLAELTHADKRNLVPDSRDDESAPVNFSGNAADLEILSVKELRGLARQYPDLVLKGREISRANRDQLIDALRPVLSKKG